MSPIRSAWPGSTLEIGKPLVLAERCELGQLALRANEDIAQHLTRFPQRCYYCLNKCYGQIACSEVPIIESESENNQCIFQTGFLMPKRLSPPA